MLTAWGREHATRPHGRQASGAHREALGGCSRDAAGWLSRGRYKGFNHSALAGGVASAVLRRRHGAYGQVERHWWFCMLTAWGREHATRH